MNNFYRSFSVFLLMLFNVPSLMATEEPTYTLVKQADDYEIRQYAPILVAETLVETNFEDAGGESFRVLADYIFGNNISKTKIAMTAPVTQQSSSEKIAMTAPVTQKKSGDKYLVQFTMPRKYTMDTIPAPKDNRVKLRELPAKKYAVYSYTGSWSQERFENKLERFKERLHKDKVATSGDPIFSRYNSPFQLWFLRRNEIWLQLDE